MVAVVQADADDLPRIGHRRGELGSVEGDRAGKRLGSANAELGQRVGGERLEHAANARRGAERRGRHELVADEHGADWLSLAIFEAREAQQLTSRRARFPAGPIAGTRRAGA